MRRALELAQEAAGEEEVPVGAVVVLDDQSIAEGRNEVEKRGDPTAHAELLAIQRAVKKRGYSRLVGATLYTTLEPCAMCAGAILLARAQRVVYGARDAKGGFCGSLHDIMADRRLNHQVDVREGLLAEESRQLLQDFFQLQRAPAGSGRQARRSQ